MLTLTSGPDANDVERARELCLELLENVKKSYDAFKERGPRGSGGGDRGGGGYDDNRGGYGQRDRNGGSNSYDANSQQYGYHQQPYGGGAQSPQAAQPQGQEQAYNMDPQQVAAWVQYYAANPDQDPYAQYGGYGAVMAQYYGQQAGYASSPTQQQNGMMPPPPGSAGEDVPPPPPPPPGA